MDAIWTTSCLPCVILLGERICDVFSGEKIFEHLHFTSMLKMTFFLQLFPKQALVFTYGNYKSFEKT